MFNFYRFIVMRFFRITRETLKNCVKCGKKHYHHYHRKNWARRSQQSVLCVKKSCSVCWKPDKQHFVVSMVFSHALFLNVYVIFAYRLQFFKKQQRMLYIILITQFSNFEIKKVLKHQDMWKYHQNYRMPVKLIRFWVCSINLEKL